jgi:hypothetical protein
MNVAEIHESRNGRFHLNKFGVEIGGENRDKPFVFRIFNAAGTVIAESCEVTARGLGIAEKGRTDYDRNLFHQKDFFAQNGQPNSPIARRVKKWFYT